MQYMIMIYSQEFEAPSPQDPGLQEHLAPWAAFNQTHAASILGAGQPEQAATATTIRRPFGGTGTIIDGPFAETKEVFGG